MTEPEGGTDPTQFKTTATLDGDEWVISGEKWFSSHARFASFLIAMVVTEPDNPPHQRLSAIVVPADSPGLEFVRHTGLWGEADGEGTHAYLRYNEVRVPADHLLGERGGGFVVAQTRLGGGRIHHAMRTVARIKWAFDAMCERAISRSTTRGEPLSRQQMVQEMIADSWAEIEQFRLLVMQTAWKIDRYQDYKQVRADISAVKLTMPKVYNSVISRALQIHGSLGLSNEMPFGSLLIDSYHVGLADGATEIHKVTAARQLMSRYSPSTQLFPSYHVPARKAAARERYADVLARHGR
jgi:acyl-CoA dehydrogenase